MTVIAATPYLILGGRAEEAIAHYRDAFGATLESLQRFGDMDASCPDAMKQLVMHAVLKLDGAPLMLSDGGPGEAPAGRGATSVALQLDDPDAARRAFDVLSSGGTVVQPLFAAPWGALFGAVHDRYGVSWMFNCDVPAGG
jgi:PhnB protein